jgi:predicted nucleotidyltransferase
MFQKILEKLALHLDKKGIDYMIIGGQAALYYGEPRLTKDIDITLNAGIEKISEILKLVSELNFKILVESPEEFIKQTYVLPCIDESSGLRIDFIFSFSPYEKQAFKRAAKIQIGKAKVKYSSVEDLIIHKIIAGRPKDIEDIKAVINKNRKIDKKYILNWLEDFEILLSKPFCKVFEDLSKDT